MKFNICAFATEHKELLSVAAIAFIAQMPDTLPAPFNKLEILNWGWEWLHKGLKTLVSFRAPSVAPAKTGDTPK